MRYRRIPLEVDAIKISVDMIIEGKQATKGDYLVTFSNGQTGVIKKAVFERDFEVSPDSHIVNMPDEPADIPYTPKENIPEGGPFFICLNCGSEVTADKFEKKSGQCVDCLRQSAECQTCGKLVKQYQILGVQCIHCMDKQKLVL